MSHILTTFGIDWHLLLINGLNFGLLMLALWYFLYDPVMKMLEERRERVAQSVKDAEAAEARLRELEASRAGLLAQAGREADALVAAGRAAGLEKQRELVEKGEAAAAALVRDAQAQALEEKARALEESKQEVAKLIVLGIEKQLAK